LPNKNTLFVGKVLHRFSALPSTNDYAAKILISEQLAEGTVIMANHQTAGRGQMGNSWETEAGQNLTLSVIFHPRFLLARKQFGFNQTISLAVRDTIAEFSEKLVKVKWPNDILIGKRKTCGILIQNTLAGVNIQSSIVGIGINVNQRRFATELTKASSLALELGRPVDLEDLMESLFHHLEARYLQLKQGGLEGIQTSYLTHLFQIGEQREYAYADGQTFLGTIIGVDPSGKLRVETQKGIELFAIKEIIFR
jgi:BirA family biotin operon repressor/biotin-[acetyl-CoA-carboxylase] ligase